MGVIVGALVGMAILGAVLWAVGDGDQATPTSTPTATVVAPPSPAVATEPAVVLPQACMEAGTMGHLARAQKAMTAVSNDAASYNLDALAGDFFLAGTAVQDAARGMHGMPEVREPLLRSGGLMIGASSDVIVRHIPAATSKFKIAIHLLNSSAHRIPDNMNAC